MGLRGDRITKLRKQQGITQSELARILDLGQNQISNYENNQINPSIDTLARIAQTLNTTTDYLMGLSDKPTPDSDPDPHPDLSPDEIEMLALMRQYDLQSQKQLVEAARLLYTMHLKKSDE